MGGASALVLPLQNRRAKLQAETAVPVRWNSTALLSSEERARGAADILLPLKNVRNAEWIGRIYVGKPLAPVDVIFDTGSADLWVAPEAYNPSASLAEKRPSAAEVPDWDQKGSLPVVIQYGKGRVEGEFVDDQVCLTREDPSSCVERATLIAATRVEQLDGRDFDGVFGLAFPGIAHSTRTVLTDVLAGLNVPKLFSFYLGRDAEFGSKLIFGAPLEIPNVTIEYHDLYEPTWWTVYLDLRVGNQLVASGPAAVDSGTSYILLPEHIFFPFVHALVPERFHSQLSLLPSSGLLACPCAVRDSIRDIVFAIGEREYRLPGYSVLLPFGFDNLCALEIQVGANSLPIVLGDSFMTRFYSVFDLENERVGLAPLPNGIGTSSAATVPPTEPAVLAVSFAVVAGAALVCALLCRRGLRYLRGASRAPPDGYSPLPALEETSTPDFNVVRTERGEPFRADDRSRL
jgi:hypothetical protein